MSYRVMDHVYDNRWVTMGDGYIVKFVKQYADVPDKYVDYFNKISDFHVQLHTPEEPTPNVVVEKVVVSEEKPIVEVKEETLPVTEEKVNWDTAKPEEEFEITSAYKKKKSFRKVTK